MEPLELVDVIRAVQGSLIKGQPAGAITGVAIDSRMVQPGDLFFAFEGARVDGHAFVGEALFRGAAAAVISKGISLETERPLILVEDTRRALQDLAGYYRRLFPVPVVGVTGSTGKTTTKDLIAGVLGSRYNVLKTRGNYNNELGLPLTLLQLNHRHQAVVLEMAMRGRGEIAALCRISRPLVGVITNIGRTHLERLGSREAIAMAKGELLEALPPEGCAVLNAGDPWQVKLGKQVMGELLFYGETADCAVCAREVRLLGLEGTSLLLRTPRGEYPCHLPFPGRHNVLNALAAAAVGHWFGLSPQEIVAGLAAANLTEMRLEVKKGIRGSRIIDDSYNANPDSVKAALELLAQEPQKNRAVAVLGDMYELGSETIPGHREVGETAARLRLDCLCTVGELAREIAAGAAGAGMPRELIHVFGQRQDALEFLQFYLEEGDLVLIKGSRGIRMEEITSGLLEQVNHHA